MDNYVIEVSEKYKLCVKIMDNFKNNTVAESVGY